MTSAPTPGEGEIEPELPPGTLSVTALSNRLQAAVAGVAATWVAGEVVLSRRPAAPGGHLYFELVERPGPDWPPLAKLSVMVPGRRSAVLGRFNAALAAAHLELTDGLPVRLHGHTQLWPGSGGLSFVVDEIDAAFSAGRLAADRTALLRLLQREGVAANQAALALPAMPLDIALVTSVNSAAYADFTRHLAESGIAFRTCVLDVRVQGSESAEAVARAIRAAARTRFATWSAQVVVVLRGGGSRTDLASFDTEVVARAICDSPLPVITGVGHETDTCLADAVAHLACKTPTAAAAELVGRASRSEARVEQLYARAASAASARFARADEGLESRLERTGLAAAHATSSAGTALDSSAHRLHRSAGALLARSGAATEASARRSLTAAGAALRVAGGLLDARAAVVAACDPSRVLARGFSITRDAHGRLVTDPANLTEGVELHTTLAGGVVVSTVAPSTVSPSTVSPSTVSPSTVSPSTGPATGPAPTEHQEQP